MEVFNNRELASIIWVIILLIWTLIKSKDFWKSLCGLVISIIRAWKIFFSIFIYTFFSIFVLYKIGIWNLSLIKITAFWLFGWAIIVLMNSSNNYKKQGYLKKIFKEIIGLTVIVSFISNLHSFSL
ncbi:hypothetical protein GW764_01575 [Candidatus Parcubacteria bacterium]|nr:hypothetical protein [Candidatus Parcubacteria bacterium]